MKKKLHLFKIPTLFVTRKKKIGILKVSVLYGILKVNCFWNPTKFLDYFLFFDKKNTKVKKSTIERFYEKYSHLL